MCGHLRKEQELAFIIKNKKSRLKVKPSLSGGMSFNMTAMAACVTIPCQIQCTPEVIFRGVQIIIGQVFIHTLNDATTRHQRFQFFCDRTAGIVDKGTDDGISSLVKMRLVTRSVRCFSAASCSS